MTFPCVVHVFRLEIIDKPVDDPQWWKARNDKKVVGLVPRNYLHVLTEETAPLEDDSDR